MNVNWMRDKHGCRQRRESIALLAAGALSGAERGAIELHLAQCEPCQRAFAEFKRVSKEVVEFAAAGANFGPTESARRSWRGAILAAGRAGERDQRKRPSPWLDALRMALGSYRSPWSILASIWALILFFKLSGPAVSPAREKTMVANPREIIMAIRGDQRPWSMLPDLSHRPLLNPPPPAPLRPRSERREETIAA